MTATQLRTMAEACERLRMCPGTLRTLIHTDRIGYVRDGRRLKFTDDHLAEYIERNTFPRPVVLALVPDLPQTA